MARGIANPANGTIDRVNSIAIANGRRSFDGAHSDVPLIAAVNVVAVSAAAMLQPNIRSQYRPRDLRPRRGSPPSLNAGTSVPAARRPPSLNAVTSVPPRADLRPYLWHPVQLRPFAFGIVPVSIHCFARGACPDVGASLIRRSKYSRAFC